MGSFSIWHWLVVGVIVLVRCGGKGKISDIMGDVAKGIKSFKKGLAEPDEDVAKADKAQEPVKHLDHAAGVAVDKSADVRKV